MTFSTLLHRGAGDRMDMSGPSGIGDGLPLVERGMDRGTYGYGGGGSGGGKGKGGSKGSQAAMSALTLLAFLFFINMLQTCLQEMSTTDETTVMIVSNATSNLIRPRPKRETSDNEEIAASVEPQVYRDSNVLVRPKGDLEEDDTFNGDNTPHPDGSDELQEDLEEDYDYPDATELSDEPEDVSTASGITNNVHQQRHLGHDTTNGVVQSTEDINQRDEHQGFRILEMKTDNPEHSEHKTNKLDPVLQNGNLYSNFEHNLQQHTDPEMAFGGFTWMMSTYISRIANNMEISHCYELVVCEMYRMSRHWGEPGIFVASGLSEALLWYYGADEGRRKAVLEAAENGRDHRNCGVHIQQCQDRSKDRSLLPFLATIVERFL